MLIGGKTVCMHTVWNTVWKTVSAWNTVSVWNTVSIDYII